MWEQRGLNTELLKEIKESIEKMSLEVIKDDLSKLEKIISILRIKDELEKRVTE